MYIRNATPEPFCSLAPHLFPTQKYKYNDIVHVLALDETIEPGILVYPCEF